MEFLRNMYKAMYNYYAGSQKNKTNPFIAAWLGITVFVFVLGINLTALISIYIRRMVHISLGKGKNLFPVVLIWGLTYILLFKILRLQKNGDNFKGTFDITGRANSIAWISFSMNIVICFVLALVRKYLFNIA
jgi:hypothetical protein